MHTNKKRVEEITSAVSIVELAVVILIIGVLVLTVSGANSLIKQSQIRKTISEINTLDTAYDEFEIIYQNIPGDMNNAYDYFGSACATTAALCNGDANGHVEGLASTFTSANTNDSLEFLRAFQHLKLANILHDGRHVGTGLESTDKTTSCTSTDKLSATCVLTPGYNVPKTAISKTGYYIVHYYSDKSIHRITLGNTNPTSADTYVDYNDRAIMSSLDAKSIDDKIDDGFANSGALLSYNDATYGEGDCTTSGTYNLTITGVNCYLRYLMK